MHAKINKPKISSRRLQAIWAQVPPDYYDRGIDKNLLQKLWHKRKLAQVLKLLPKQKKGTAKVLDIGCSSAILTNEISRTLKKSKVTGLDSYKAAIVFARSKYPHIKFVIGDAHKLPFKNRAFDIIICTETLEHVVDPAKSIQEMRRVLKADGQTIISMDSGSLLFHLIWHLWIKTKGRVWQDAHLHEFNAKLLEKLIKENGFRISKKITSHLGMSVTFLAVPKKIVLRTGI